MDDHRSRRLSDHERAEVDRILQLAAPLAAAERESLVRAQSRGNDVVRDESLSLLAYAGNPAMEALLETPPPMPPRLGARPPRSPLKTAGPYKLIRHIGRGGMGDVYLAERSDDRLGTQYAVKVIRAGMDTEDVLRRFELEGEVLRELDHPNIARFIDAGRTDGGHPYLVLEYVDGRRLDEHCDAGALGVPERLRLFRQLCEAVGYLNRYMVVHRDIKPSNVLVTSDGTVKLLDLGVAKLLDPSEPEVTEYGGRPVTPEYSAPEQVAGRPVGTSADVYALGVVLYELLTGQGPYHATREQKSELEQEILTGKTISPSGAIASVAKGNGALRRGSAPEPLELASIVEARGTSPDRLRRRLKGDLDQIVMKALRKDPDARYDSATRLAEDVDRHLASKVVVVGQTPWRRRVTKFVARNRIPVGVTSLVVLAAVASGVALVKSNRAAADEELAEVTLQFFTDVVASIDDDLKGVGRTEARARMLDGVVSRLDVLMARAPDDPKFIGRIATMYERLGRVQGGPRDSNQGDVVGAAGSYETALSLYLAVLDEEPDDVETQLSVAGLFRRLGDLRKASDLEGALDYYDKARRYLVDIAVGEEPALDVTNRLATIDRARADMFVRMDEFVQAEAIYREYLAVAEARVAEDPSRINRRNQGTAHMRVGRALCGQDGRLEEARRYFNTNVEIRTALLAQDADDDVLQRDYWSSHYAAAWALWEVAPEVALGHLAQGETIVTTLAGQFDPGDVRPRRDLAYHREIEGQAHEQLGHDDEALVAFREFHDIARELHARAVDKWPYESMLGHACLYLGRMDDDPDAKRLLLEEALARLDPLAAASPSDRDLTRAVEEARERLAAIAD